MKHRILLAAVLLLPALVPGTYAQDIVLVSDAGTWEAIDSSPGMLTVHVLHIDTSRFEGLSFAIRPSSGFTGVWTGDHVRVLSYTGATPWGLNVWYDCGYSEDVVLADVTYEVFGTSESCSYLEVVGPDFEASGLPLGYFCWTRDSWYLSGGRLHINCGPTPVTPSTWGSVKALYR